MNIRSIPLVFSVAACGAPLTAKVSRPSETQSAVASPSAAPEARNSPETAEVGPQPTRRTAKEKLLGIWQFSFEGDLRDQAEAAARKKFPSEKDGQKLEEYMKKVEEDSVGEWMEFKDGYYSSHVTKKGTDKVTSKMKYDVLREDGTSVTVRANGKDEISNKEIKDEITLVFIDDDTLAVVDPKSKMKFIYRRKK